MTAPGHHPLDSIKALPPTFTGNVPIHVGDMPWGMTPGSRLHRESRGNDKCVFVLTPEHKVHMLGVRGGKVVEFVGPPEVASRMTMLAVQEWFE